jgi:hypothetical protein
MLKSFFNAELAEFLRAKLAETLKDEGKTAEAQDIARPICANKSEIQAGLAKEGLCPGATQ